MEFLTWWFDQHPVWSTLFCPFGTIIWGIYTNNTLKVLWAVIWYFIILFGKISNKP